MIMNFKEIVPTRVRSGIYMGDKVKIGFPIIQQRQQLVIFFGRDVAEKIGVVDGSKLKLFIEESNPLIWLLKKGDESRGWKIVDLKKTKSKAEPLYKMQLAWNQPVPQGFEDKEYKFVTHDVYDSGIRLYLPKADKIEKELT